MRVDLESLHAYVGEGRKAIPLPSRLAALFLDAVVSAKGAWITCSEIHRFDPELEGSRCGPIRKTLPRQLQKIVKSRRGKGFRLTLDQSV